MKTFTFHKLVFVVAACFYGSAFAQPVTYDFTGTVLAVGGIYSSISDGTTVSGTYTFNFDAAIPQQSSGTAGSGNWGALADGGSYFSLPVPSAYVFTSTAQVGGFTYSTGVLSSTDFYNESFIEGSGAYFVAQEEVDPNLYSYTRSGISVFGYMPDGLPFPNTSYNTYNTGFFLSNLGGVSYSINSLTFAPISSPVPEPKTYGMLLAGLGMMGFMVRRNKSA